MRYSLRKEEWKHFNILKKIFMMGVEAVGFGLIGLLFYMLIFQFQMERLVEYLIYIVMLGLLLFYWTLRMMDCMWNRFLCVPSASVYISKRDLKEHMMTQIFHDVPGIRRELLQESEYWYYLCGRFIAKNMTAGICRTETSMVKNSKVIAEIIFVDGKGIKIKIGATADKEVMECYHLCRESIPGISILTLKGNMMFGPRKKEMRRLFREYLETMGQNRMDIVQKQDGLNAIKPYCNREAYELYMPITLQSEEDEKKRMQKKKKGRK